MTVKTKLENGLYGWEISRLGNNGNSTFQVESQESGSSSDFPGNGFIVPTEGLTTTSTARHGCTVPMNP